MDAYLDLKYFVKYQFLSRLPYNRGYCPICEKETFFVEYDKWLRDGYKCHHCGSIPRNRALVQALILFYPEWRNSIIHESSPGGILSDYLERNAKNYTSSHFFEDIPRGQYKDKFRSENLSELTFADNSIELFITSDVFEHVMEPFKAFKEIARVLKPGGSHIFTMPWYPKKENTIQRAKIESGDLIFLEEPVYHGNPIDNRGSLVTFDWGIDFPELIFKASGLITTVLLQRDRSVGIDGEFLEVFKSSKPLHID